MENRFRHLSTAELYAIEKQARQARAAEMARVLVAGVEAVKSLVSRLAGRVRAAAVNTKGVRHA